MIKRNLASFDVDEVECILVLRKLAKYCYNNLNCVNICSDWMFLVCFEYT
jgi:hypothetical protein